jgi:hypothetical protein
MLWPMAIVLFVLANAGFVAIVAPNRRTAERRHELACAARSSAFTRRGNG